MTAPSRWFTTPKFYVVYAMIKYELTCGAGHDFEAWFNCSATCDEQLGAEALSCPICASTLISKRPMAPAIQSSRSKARTKEADEPKQNASSASPIFDEFRNALRAFKADLMANTENVGAQFAETARRIHYGEEATRAIRGSATIDEARDLLDEGIDFGVLPVTPDDHN